MCVYLYVKVLLLGVMGSHHQPSDPESDALHIELTPILSLTH